MGLSGSGSGTVSESDDRIDVRGDGRIILYKRQSLEHPK
jgi:hypothetical protein